MKAIKLNMKHKEIENSKLFRHEFIQNIFSSFIAISFIISINSFAKEKINFEKNILKGLEHSYHFNWDKAELTFKDLIESYPERPEGYHFLSSVYAWYYLSSKNKSDLDSQPYLLRFEHDLQMCLLPQKHCRQLPNPQ